jgi:hypothetical protein
MQMTVRQIARRFTAAMAAVVLASATAFAQAQQATKPFEPTVGQPGKDVVWVPTPQATVDMMLNMANVTPQDFLMDLGSGDGRTVITAAKRGLRATGVEYNPDMVALSQKNAAEAGVTERATFIRGDIFETDFSKATVLTLFLLPDLNIKLRPTILNMRPGTRVVSNSFTMGDWEADETRRVETDCTSWCTGHLWIVPAKVAGSWQLAPGSVLVLEQTYQMISGTLTTNGTATAIKGRLRGDQITFTAGTTQYSGIVSGNSIKGTGGPSGSWTATKR